MPKLTKAAAEQWQLAQLLEQMAMEFEAQGEDMLATRDAAVWVGEQAIRAGVEPGTAE